ncbi:MAG: hypothetical protein C4K58_00805 [Flavobacteriaceae bacterium]|nr:MAG: hypothetical protein C4K58_00805 [Flavobacteriaceae bacterium]
MSKTYTLVPEKGGSFRVSPSQFVYFDPKRQEYVSIQVPGAEIFSSQENTTKPTGESAKKPEDTTSGNPFKEIKESVFEFQNTLTMKIKRNFAANKNIFYFLIGAFLLGIFMVTIPRKLWIKYKRKQNEENRASFFPQLKELEDLIAQDNREEFLNLADGLILEIPKKYLKIENSQLETKFVHQSLKEKYDFQIADLWKELYQDLDQLRYSPALETEVGLVEHYVKIKKLIHLLKSQT